MKSFRAYAHTNIALIKYWGKRAAELNLPATGSLSLTLNNFGTETQITHWNEPEDAFFLDGQSVTGQEAERVFRFLDLFRRPASPNQKCVIRSTNHVPTAAGLASSASAFAALALAANRAFDRSFTDRELSIYARQGSGSAARSIYGGFVRMHAGEGDDGLDSFAEKVESPDPFKPALLVVKCAVGRKKVGSTQGMTHTSETSPYFPAWVETHLEDLDAATRFVKSGQLEQLGEVMEFSTLKMHATAMAARPGLWYLSPTTWRVLNHVRDLRDQGARCFFTMDAGPHVKVLCHENDAEELKDALGQVEDIGGVESTLPGPNAYIMDES
jgi:diphosphomevalonate decarboxylase